MNTSDSVARCREISRVKMLAKSVRMMAMALPSPKFLLHPLKPPSLGLGAAAVKLFLIVAAAVLVPKCSSLSGESSVPIRYYRALPLIVSWLIVQIG